MAERLTDILAEADKTYANLPDRVLLAVDEIVSRMPEYGPRKLRKSGPGTDLYNLRPFRPGYDDPRMINHKLSARVDYQVVAERQAENRQPVFFWRKGYGTTTVDYNMLRGKGPSLMTKKEYLEVAMLAAAKAISKSEDMIGVLGEGTAYRGSIAQGRLAAHFLDTNIVTGHSPDLPGKIPHGSTVVLGSDFLLRTPESKAEFEDTIQMLHGAGANGKLIMVLDPVELDFPFQGATRFRGKEGERPLEREEARSLREEYNRRISSHVEWVADTAHAHGFQFILQRTDSPPIDLVFKIFGIDTDAPAPRLTL